MATSAKPSLTLTEGAVMLKQRKRFHKLFWVGETEEIDMAVIVPWVIIAVILLVVGIVLIVAALNGKFSKVWTVVLTVIGLATIGAGTYWFLFLVGLVNS